MKYTDTQLLNFLQQKNDEATYTGKCLFRMSGRRKGWRLHETSRPKAKKSVREAIVDALDKEKGYKWPCLKGE